MLHGEVKVNHIEIGKWQAQNTGEKVKDFVVYRCEAEWYTNTGYPFRTGPFLVHHKPNDGALVLASIVLAQAKKLFDIETSR